MRSILIVAILLLLSLYHVIVLSGEGKIVSPTMPVLRATLLDMANEDQEHRLQMTGDANISEVHLKSLNDIDKVHTDKLKLIYAEHGWPNTSMIGQDGVQAFWLLAQHSSDFDFQRTLLPHVQKAFDTGEIDANNYALFVDRLLVHEGKPQKYGTQIKEWINKTPILFPVENRGNVNVLRGSIGLFDLEDYLLLVKYAAFPEENMQLPFSDHDAADSETGIGLVFDIKGSGPIEDMTVQSFTVDKVKVGSMAANAGINIGDQVIKIDGVLVEGSNINTLITAMDKPVGDDISLVIKRPDGSLDKIDVEITAISSE
jgi:hypothetical protein